MSAYQDKVDEEIDRWVAVQLEQVPKLRCEAVDTALGALGRARVDRAVSERSQSRISGVIFRPSDARSTAGLLDRRCRGRARGTIWSCPRRGSTWLTGGTRQVGSTEPGRHSSAVPGRVGPAGSSAGTGHPGGRCRGCRWPDRRPVPDSAGATGSRRSPTPWRRWRPRL
jgi:hypothetical protein